MLTYITNECMPLEKMLARVEKTHPEGCELVRKAYEFAENAHRGQVRKSGEPYFMHPVSVASILTHLFDGGTVHRTEDNLTYGPACTGTLPPEQLPSIHFAAFQRRGVPFYTYHLPVEITDSFDVRTLTLSIPDGVKTPVVIDPFTRDVYTAADKLYPITDYPLVLMDAEAAREFADFTLCAGSAETADLRQQAHE